MYFYFIFSHKWIFYSFVQLLILVFKTKRKIKKDNNTKNSGAIEAEPFFCIKNRPSRRRGFSRTFFLISFCFLFLIYWALHWVSERFWESDWTIFFSENWNPLPNYDEFVSPIPNLKNGPLSSRVSYINI